MQSSTGYVSANGPTRKFRAAATAAVSIGPALVVIVQYLLTLLPSPVPANVAQAIAVLIEAATVLVVTYATAPGAPDQVVPAPAPVAVAPVSVPVVVPAPVVAVPVAPVVTPPPAQVVPVAPVAPAS